MKNLYWSIGFIPVFGMLFQACSDDDPKTNGNQTQARFLQEQVAVPAAAGEVIVLLEWSFTPWEIVMDIVAGHLYQGFTDLSSSYVKNRHDYICGLYYGKLAGANKTWWMTEKLFNDGQNEEDRSLWKFHQWSYNLETLGKEIHMCMEGYCSAYIYWYLKRFYGMMGDNDARSLLGAGEITKNGYILSHYARYASGMTRIKVETGDSQVLATAYLNDENTEMTAVLLNMKKETFNIRVSSNDAISDADIIETAEDKNRVTVTALILEDQKTVSALLSAGSITSIKLKLK